VADDVTIDRKTLRALGADTRITILKKLSSRRSTQAELAQALSLSQPAVKEHLESLLDAGLVARIESDHKWKYYEITEKGTAIVGPTTKKIWFILGVSLCAFIASVASAYQKILPQPLALQQPEMMKVAAVQTSAPLMDAAVGVGSTAAENAAAATSSLPTAEFLIIAISLIAIGACLALIIKQKR